MQRRKRKQGAGCGPNRIPCPADLEVDDLTFVNPRGNSRIRHAKGELIPASLFEGEVCARFVVGSVPAVDARKPDDVTAPPARYPRAKGIAKRKSQAGEEIAARKLFRFEADLVVRARKLARERHARERMSGTDHQRAILYLRGTAPAERRLTPAAERFAVEQRLPFGLGGRGGRECEQGGETQRHSPRISQTIVRRAGLRSAPLKTEP